MLRNHPPPGQRPCVPILQGRRGAIAAACACLLLSAAGANLLASPKDPLGVPREKVLGTTTINAGPEMWAALTEFFTGDKDERSVVNILVGLYKGSGADRKLLSSRDYNAEMGGYVSRGSLQIIDLDRDGTTEVLVEYHHKEKPGSTRVDLDVLWTGSGRFKLAWSGPVRMDTTDRRLDVPPSDREKFVREIEFGRTAAEQGRKICFKKTVFVAAGAVFDPPRIVFEDLDLAGQVAPPAAKDPGG